MSPSLEGDPVVGYEGLETSGLELGGLSAIRALLLASASVVATCCRQAFCLVVVAKCSPKIKQLVLDGCSGLYSQPHFLAGLQRHVTRTLQSEQVGMLPMSWTAASNCSLSLRLPTY